MAVGRGLTASTVTECLVRPARKTWSFDLTIVTSWFLTHSTRPSTTSESRSVSLTVIGRKLSGAHGVWRFPIDAFAVESEQWITPKTFAVQSYSITV